MTPTITLVSHCAAKLPFTLQELLIALRELASLVRPAWNLLGEVALAGPGSFFTDPTQWPLVLADRAEQAGELGHHGLDGGRPYGVCYLQDALDQGKDPGEVAGHELIELWSDPWCRAAWPGPGWSYYAGEYADPVQGSTFKSAIGVTLPNFVLPRWFGLANHDAADRRVDHLGLLDESFQVLPAGYASVWTPGDGWRQTWGGPPGRAAAMRKLAQPGSRLARRFGRGAA